MINRIDIRLYHIKFNILDSNIYVGFWFVLSGKPFWSAYGAFLSNLAFDSWPSCSNYLNFFVKLSRIPRGSERVKKTILLYNLV
jgi:hypothetical protein